MNPIRNRTDEPMAPTPTDRAAGFALLDGFVAAHRADPAAWVVAPLLRAYYKDKPELVRLRTPLGRLHVQRLVAAHAHAALTVPTTADLVLADGVLFAMDTSRHRWVLEPLSSHAPSGRPARRTATRRLPLRAVAAGSRSGVRLADALVRRLLAEDLPAAVSVHALYANVLAARRHLAAFDRMLAEVRPRAVVLATNHNIPSRALALTAQRHRVPVVYLPHAPLIRDERFADIPADFAGLRGPAEAERVARLALAPERIAVVGDPSLEARAAPEVDPDGPVAFALPSILTDDEMRDTVRWIRAAAGDDVIVSPHPRQGEAYARQFAPPAWEVWNQRTVDVLRQGPPVVIQQSSGVAVEALLLGLPTLQIDLPEHPANYPALDPAHVPFVGSEDAMVRAVAEARAAAGDSARRSALIDWGRRWSAHQGAEAVGLAWALVERAAAEGPGPTFLNDAWGRL